MGTCLSTIAQYLRHMEVLLIALAKYGTVAQEEERVARNEISINGKWCWHITSSTVAAF